MVDNPPVIDSSPDQYRSDGGEPRRAGIAYTIKEMPEDCGPGNGWRTRVPAR